ncbi:hypothetical protein HOY80DRAFT_988484 [Tuber brumale]|nr:hypothetical protein HOY80DRAFT_988484 [Tuber brumale]
MPYFSEDAFFYVGMFVLSYFAMSARVQHRYLRQLVNRYDTVLVLLTFLLLFLCHPRSSVCLKQRAGGGSAKSKESNSNSSYHVGW